jgi:sugar phosphate isomerase/epimerase
MTARIAGFGFTTIGGPDLADLDRALGRIEDSGATHCELALCSAHVVAGGRIIPEVRRRLERACGRRKLAYTTHGALTVNFMDERHLERHEAVCRAMLELSAAVGASVMVHHPGLIPATDAAEIARLEAVERGRLRAMGDHAAALGLKLAVETLFVENEHQHTADPVRLARHLAEVDHPHVVGTLDISHSFIISRMRGIDPIAAIRAFAPVANHVHLHDSFGMPTTLPFFYSPAERMAFGMGDLHLPLGWGDLPFTSLLPTLPLRPGTVLNVELPDRFWGELEATAEVARRLVELCNAA